MDRSTPQAGADVGTSLTKYCWKEGEEYRFASTADMSTAEVVLKLKDLGIKRLKLAGTHATSATYLPAVASDFQIEQLGGEDPIEVEKSLQAEGARRLTALAGEPLRDFVLVSIGTGTSFRRVRPRGSCHFRFGTGVGGGWIAGHACSRGIAFDRIEELASTGKLLDLLVREAVPSLAGTPFGEHVLAHHRKATARSALKDKCASDVHMAAVLIVRDLLEPPAGMDMPRHVMFIGTVVKRLPTFRAHLERYTNMLGLTPFFHEQGEFALALGAYHAHERENAVVTEQWKCYECNHIGPVETFDVSDSHRCPKCKKEEYAFPHRIFRCLGCDYRADQGEFFDDRSPGAKDPNDVDLDPDPVERNWPFTCRECEGHIYERVA